MDLTRRRAAVRLAGSGVGHAAGTALGASMHAIGKSLAAVTGDDSPVCGKRSPTQMKVCFSHTGMVWLPAHRFAGPGSG